MYYQYNPLAQCWGDMYWGHAVSTDLMNWRDPPISLQPQEKVLMAKEKKVERFSGARFLLKTRKSCFITQDIMETTEKTGRQRKRRSW
ncbi:MAG: glycoside hydrolase family 32 protein [Hungatella sp.]|nr:glycoside hydrolase family 32 protein [Hungatella sp.]MCI9637965.1 glycoside hydrolase family 32 protein [Hungatella sp.]